MLPTDSCTLARAAALVALQIDGDRLGEVVAEVADVFLCERLSCDDWVTLVLRLNY